MQHDMGAALFERPSHLLHRDADRCGAHEWWCDVEQAFSNIAVKCKSLAIRGVIIGIPARTVLITTM